MAAPGVFFLWRVEINKTESTLYYTAKRAVQQRVCDAAGADTDGGSEGSTPHLSWKMGRSGGVFFFDKKRHNKQKLSINLTFFPFSFDEMFTSSSF